MIGNRLCELRETHHLTQADLGELLHITASAYSYYENGIRQPPLETLLVCAEFYHVSLDYLYERTDNPQFFPLRTDHEVLLLRHYRDMDDRGRDSLLHLAYHEYNRQKHLEEKIREQEAQRAARRNAHKNPFLQH